MGLNNLRTTVIDLRGGMPDEIRSAWNSLQQENPALQSPYFSAGFTEIIAAAGRPVELALLEDAGKILGIFPFERRLFGFSRPVGSFISDYQGMICAPELKFDMVDIIRSCRLVAWNFDNQIQAQTNFAPFHHKTSRSPIIDLAGGYKAYVHERNTAGTEQIKKNNNLLRRLEREIGPLRFVAHSPTKELLDTVLQWKTEQFRRNRWRDIFSIPWVRHSMESIHAAQTPNFAGMLSAIYAGDQLVAAHFGMRSATVWHYWFPAYDQKFARYSPGVMLLLKMAEVASSLGIKTIDLGCGEHSYKWRLMNDFVPTASGSVALPGPLTFARRVWTPIENLPRKTRHLIGKTPFGQWARRLRDHAQ